MNFRFQKYVLKYRKLHIIVENPVCRYLQIKSNKMETKFQLSERLSSLVLPVHYNLLLKPDLVKGVFEGTVKIDLAVHEEKKYINLHTKYLEITSVKLSSKHEEIPISKFLEVKHIEQLLINIDGAIQKGKYQLKIDFSGNLTKSLVGFYLSKLKNERTMVASKFQPTYARQAFPCFDEPDFKATFDIALVKPLSYVALSNMNEISSRVEENGKTEIVTFATSVPMSTYLACFVICDFDFKQNEINSSGIGNNFILRSYGQKDQMHKIEFAQDIGKRATEFYIQYYNVPFPLPKLDMIAIPDYVSGATEHWGLITYRETSFLVDEATASSRNKMNVANTVAHELAHMWFGNLVTMKWWDDIWLNEGFASYMQVKALNAIEPTWSTLDQFLTKMHNVLVTDAKLSSHPIVQTVSTPDEITAIFDAISYTKGSSLLRMFEGFIGEENFRLGVSDYLKKHEFGNTVTSDLLTALEPYFNKKYSKVNLSYIVDTWTRQMGYPLLTVTKGQSANLYDITQKRFLIDPEAVYKNDSPFNYRWFVPVTYKTSDSTYENVVWFPDTADKVSLLSDGKEKWIKINNNQVGYYRVNYSTEIWNDLIDELKTKSKQLTISDRSHLLDDVFALAEAGVVSYDLALSLSTYLKVEEDYVPWETANSVFMELSERLIHTEAYDGFEKYVRTLLTPLYEKQSWERKKNGVIEGLLRTTILSMAVTAQLPDAENQIRSKFLEWLNSHGSSDVVTIEPDLRDLVYYYGMRSATEAEWEKLWNIYLKEEDVQEQAKLRYALAAPKDSNLLLKYLTLAWEEEYIRSQDYLNVLYFVSDNPSGSALAWDELRARWPRLVQRYSLNSRYLGNIVPAITASFNSPLKLQEMEAFFMQYPDAGAGESGRRRALETIRNNIKWAAKNQAAVHDWLKTHQFL